MTHRIHRRRVLKSAAAFSAASLAATSLESGWPSPALGQQHDHEVSTAVTQSRIQQSIVQWCFAKYWDVEQMCQIAKQLGCRSIELIDRQHWATLKRHGLTCALAGSHSFVQGMNNPKYHDGCIAAIQSSIDACADAGFPAVISFTGFAADTGAWADGLNPLGDRAADPAAPQIDPDEGIKNCIAGYKKVVGYAEQKKVNIALEMLNSRVNESMKGHPGYQGDHVDYCMEIIRQVGSPRLGLLFDIYHVQIMDGDIIQRIHECGDAIKHVHTAGNPGRRELDDQQEINYPPIMRALLDINYQGYVGQEFIPTAEPLVGLTDAVKLCAV
ncbi:MAG: TIM barrel protein [Pirellulaceae bacterium]